uniref:Uncharacterized protein n=1 Tax=Anguilla anguilla TaxID=7936 RepID=A0A0E9RK09_ANGAN
MEYALSYVSYVFCLKLLPVTLNMFFFINRILTLFSK